MVHISPKITNLPSESTTTLPYLTVNKTPEWIPLFSQENIIDRNFPLFSLDPINQLEYPIETSSLESNFWYFFLKKYLKIPNTPKDKQFYDILLRCEIESDNKIGFTQNPLHLWNVYRDNKHNSSTPDLFSTFYVLHMMKYLNKLEGYFLLDNGRKKPMIQSYIHGLLFEFKSEKNYPDFYLLYLLLNIFHLLGVSPKAMKADILSKLDHPKKGRDELFRCLCLKILERKDPISAEDLYKFHRYEKVNGGFTFQNSAYADITDTFWVGYTLEVYHWLLPYRAGPIYAFVIRQLKEQKWENKVNEEIKIINYSQIVLLLAIIFNTLMDETEELIFKSLSSNGLMDLDILSRQGGFNGVEKDIIGVINGKYQFRLDILNNDLLFRRFLNRLNPFEEKVTSTIREKVQTYSRINLTEVKKQMNRSLSRGLRIKDQDIVELTNRMVEESFFTGAIIRKNKFPFGKTIYFERDEFIENIIVCDRPVSWEHIRNEKRRVLEISKDIFNMSIEMETSSKIIMDEIESLIIVGIDPEYIEERLTYNIKKTIMDASFFNKAIENFASEFEFLSVNQILASQYKRWDAIYSSLQQNFHNIRRILSVKISSLREGIDQYNLTLKLEELINRKISEYTSIFTDFQQSFQDQLDQNYSRDLIQDFIENLLYYENNLKTSDIEIQQYSLKITSKENSISDLRKKIIKRWITELSEYTNVISYYRLGIGLYQQKIKEIDTEYSDRLKNLDSIAEKITQFTDKQQFEDALTFSNQTYDDLLKDVQIYSKSLKKEIDKYYKRNRKLSPLIRQIYTEWLESQNKLEDEILKKRDYFLKTIEKDLYSHIEKSFQVHIKKTITSLRQQLLRFEKEINSLLGKDGAFPHQDYENGIQNLRNALNSGNNQLETKFQDLGKNYKIDKKQSFIDFEVYSKEFELEIDRLERKFAEDELIHMILKYSLEKNQNYIPISTISQMKNLSEKDIFDQISNLISEGRINALLINDPVVIEVHNEDWRNSQNLNNQNNIILREIENNALKIQQVFNQAISNNDFINKIPNLRTLCTNFKQTLFIRMDEYELVIQDAKMNMKNPIIEKKYLEFHNQLQVFKQNMDQIHSFCNFAEEFQNFLFQQIQLLENTINSEIHRISTFVDNKRKDSTYQQNIDWMKSQKSIIDEGIEIIHANINHFKESKDLTALKPIIDFLEENFKQQKRALMANYSNSVNDGLEKLSSQEILTLQKKMDHFLQDKQNLLSSYLKKSDLDIKVLIRSKQFLTSSKKLKDRQKIMEKRVKLYDKEIKLHIKNISSQSKIFSIKLTPYYLDQWQQYLQNFQESLINANFLALRSELILHFTRFTIKSLKGNFVPLSIYTEDLDIKYDDVKHTLMSLISEDILPGKLDITHDIYFEGSESIDAETIASLDIIKRTNVKTYLALKRVSNVFKELAPLLTVIGTLLSIIFYLTRLSTSIFIILSPVIVALLFFFIIWLKKGRDRVLARESNGK